MRKKTISGTVVYQNLGTGFWGIIDEDSREWRPIQMPANLQQKGKKVTLTIKEANEEMSIFMWGTPIEIISVVKG